MSPMPNIANQRNSLQGPIRVMSLHQKKYVIRSNFYFLIPRKGDLENK